jgi:hypothetical protein
MTFQQKLELMKTKMFDLISNKEITFLKDLDKKIIINKNGHYKYFKCRELCNNNILKYLNQLEDNKIYILSHLFLLMIDQMNLILF